MNLEYSSQLEPAEEGGFVVTFPGVSEAITQGEDEALARAADALETALEFYTEEGRDLPKSPASLGAANTPCVPPRSSASTIRPVLNQAADGTSRPCGKDRSLG